MDGHEVDQPQTPPSYLSIKDKEGCPIKDPGKLFHHMHWHFSSTVASGHVDWDFIQHLPARDEWGFADISLAEILEALRSTSNASAPGNDHIMWRHLKLVIADEEAVEVVALLFNSIVNEGTWPSQFKDVNSAIIPKPKKPAYNTPKAF